MTEPGVGVPTAVSLLEHAWSQPSPQTLQGTTKMRIQTPGRNARFRGVLIAQAPQQARAEVLSILGQPVAYLVTSPTELSLYSPYSDMHLSSDDPDAVLERVAAGALTSPDLVGLLLGQVPTCEPQHKGELTSEGGAYAIACVEDGEVVRTLTFDAQTWLLRSVTGRSAQAGTFQVLLDDNRTAEGYTLPYHVQFSAPSLGLDAELNYDEIAFDQPVDPGLFVLAVPPGLNTRTFEELLDSRHAAPASDDTSP